MFNRNGTNIINVTNVSLNTDYNPLHARIIKNSEVIRRSANWGLMQVKKLAPDYDEKLIIRHFLEHVKP